MADSVEKHGVILTFACGPLGRQIVEVNVGSEQRSLTLWEFTDLVHAALSVVLKRLGERNVL
jgi:hypothetical protein